MKTEDMIHELRTLSVSLPEITDPSDKMEIPPLLRKAADRLEEQKISIEILNDVLDMETSN